VQQLLYSGGESFIEIKTIERQLIKELKRNGLWNYGKEAITHTLHDIERFKKFITLIQDNAISSEEKYSAAIYVKTFNNSLKLLSNMIDERDFSIFYNYYVLDKNRNIISDALNIDVTTISRTKYKALRVLSIILYPDLNMLDMII